MRLLLFSLSLTVSELTNETYELFSHNVIMFLDNSPAGKAAYDAVVEASE